MVRSRKDYYVMIWKYKERREQYKKKYNGDIPFSKTELYKRVTARIGQWQKEIKRLDARKARINIIMRAVNKYFNVNISDRNTHSMTDESKKENLARYIFFKIGLESRICGTHLGRHIGRSHYDCARLGRKKLNRMLQNNPEIKVIYYQFKKHFENELKQGAEEIQK